MILNEWRLSDGRALWMAETGEDPEGNIHTISIIVQQENPDRLLEQTGELDEGLEESRVLLDDAREGLYLRLMLDGEGETIFDLGTNMPVTEFASIAQPAKLAWHAVEQALEHRQRRAVDARLRQIAD